MHIPYTSSDLWLLLAIDRAGGQRGAPLERIISAGDAINKAIFTPAELRRGFAKLIAGGYIADMGGRFAVTPVGGNLLKRVQKQGGSIMETWDALNAELGATAGAEDHPSYKDPVYCYTPLTDDALSLAYKQARVTSDAPN